MKIVVSTPTQTEIRELVQNSLEMRHFGRGIQELIKARDGSESLPDIDTGLSSFCLKTKFPLPLGRQIRSDLRIFCPN